MYAPLIGALKKDIEGVDGCAVMVILEIYLSTSFSSLTHLQFINNFMKYKEYKLFFLYFRNFTSKL